MKNLKGFYKNNRVYVILMGIALICLAVILVLAVKYFIGQTNGNPYGDRLNGIETVEITAGKKNELKESIEENEIVDTASVKVIGKIIYINVYLNSGKGSDAKNIAIKTLDAFTDDEKAFYDFSYIFDMSAEDEDVVFPIMGYKKSDNTIISWTNFSE